MQTTFSPDQLADPVVTEADRILRKCVHCGFCTATCPTYVLRGDELDSPRGRIYLIKDLYERGGPPPASTVKHLDRCLSCLSCMTTCPSGVDYRHLVDAARLRIDASPQARPLADRLLRGVLAKVLTSRRLFRWSLRAAHLAKPLAGLMPARLRAMVALAPQRLSPPSHALDPQTFPAEGRRVARVALLGGCVQAVLDAEINAATIRLLTRHGVEVVVAAGAECCGALPYHMGRQGPAVAKARATIEAWWRETAEGGGQGLDAVVVDASGCGSTIKDYGHMLAGEGPELARKAQVIAGLAADITEMIERLGLSAPRHPTGQRVAYHSACSLQHGQRIRTTPQRLLEAAGFDVREIPESHLCCGSAGTYNMLQPELSHQLKERKQANIRSVEPEIVAAGNIGCLVQIANGLDIPVVHTVQLLDWATGGPKPPGMG
jgi:glycolate oxidase iron-sulfur subunit